MAMQANLQHLKIILSPSRLRKYSHRKYEAGELEELLRVSKDRAFFCHPVMKKIRAKSITNKKLDNNQIVVCTGLENLPTPFLKKKAGPKK